MTQPIIVFDLDGTLLDTAPDLLDSLNHCLKQTNVPEIDTTDIRRFVGFGARVMIDRAYASHSLQATDQQLDTALEIFLDHYTQNMPGNTIPYPGVLESIGRFHNAGYLTAICTNKLEHLSKRLLEGLNLTSKFASICGADTFEFRKPDPRHLFETIALSGGDASRAVMIGDSRTDIDTAKAAGIPVVAVDFGYTDQPVHIFEPSKVISHFNELTVDLAETLIHSANQ